ncbi:hypothetical protein [uncultured Levyella sp.]|uniref:hypothetical protein n=1 Tax=uncultured Levyella sp. TaxID=1715800 RepID=UPI002587977D|nr:hypothetical protein [uncultured Levyella sp.]
MSMTFKLNRKGVRELLHDPSIAEEINAKAKAIQGRAGEGFEALLENNSKKTRAVATVRAVNRKAVHECFKNNLLLKVIR